MVPYAGDDARGEMYKMPSEKESNGKRWQVLDTKGMVTPSNEKDVAYRRIRLENGLEALLVSDPDTDKSAASVDVRVGHLSDPKELPGLAHFTEHMLFYASEKYPKEDEYSKFISEHGGFCNAFTAAEDTNYYFDVNSSDFSEALDRFAQFFVSPLISRDGVNREIKAVDSENSKNLNNDIWRSMQLWRHISKEDHVFHKFGTGSMETLLKKPESEGIDTHERMLSFYTSEYSANLMKLSVYAKESLDTLEDMVVNVFHSVRSTNKKEAIFKDVPFSSEHEGQLIKVLPVRDAHELDIQWLVPPEIPTYQYAPCQYLSHLIGHEGEGSILKLLKDLKWATSLSAGEGPESYSAFSVYLISIELTEEGNKHIMEILQIVFQYIAMLRKEGVQKWIFDELKSIADTRFNYRDKQNPGNYVRNLTSSMQLYNEDDLLLAMHHVPQAFNEKAVLDILDCMTPEKVRVMWSTTAHKDVVQEKEPWYGTEYSMECIDPSSIKQWTDCEIPENLHLPARNNYLPTDFSLHTVEGEHKVPEKIYESEFSTLWFKPETLFKTPKGQVCLSFALPDSYSSPETAVCSNLFTKLLVDAMNEVTYYAEVAGLGYSIQSTTTGINLIFSGYTHKLFVLAREVIERIISFQPKVERFNVLKEQLQKDFFNTKFDQPYQQALYNSSVLFLQRKWHIKEYLEVLPELTFEVFEGVVKKLMLRTSIQSFILGNFTPAICVEFIESVENMLKSKLKARPIFQSQKPEKRVMSIPEGKEYVYECPVAHDAEENSAIDVVFQVGQDSFKQNVLLQLWVQVAERDAFHKLRTIEQIGYIVCVTQWSDHNVKSIHFILQSTSHSPTKMDHCIESFLCSFKTRLEEMKDEEFQGHIKTLEAVKLEKLKNLGQEAKRYWREIEEGSFHFDRQEKEVSELQKLTKNDLLQFSSKIFEASCNRRRKVSVHLVSQKLKGQVLEESKSADASSATTSIEIKDAWSFKRSLPVFPASLK